MKVFRKKLDLTKPPTVARTLTDREKVALLDLVNECDKDHRHVLPVSLHHKDILKAFLGEQKLKQRDITLHHMLLRMIDTCPEESGHRQHLEKHLVLRCRLRADMAYKTDQDKEKAIRTLELEWTSSLLESLDKLRRTKSSMAVGNQLLSAILEQVAIGKASH